MALVRVVDGFGSTVGRSVARPFGYGRGLIAADPAYGPYLSGRYAPVRVAYTGPSVRKRTGNEVTTNEDEGAPVWGRGSVTEEWGPLLGDEEPTPQSTTLVPQPEAGGQQGAPVWGRGSIKEDWGPLVNGQQSQPQPFQPPNTPGAQSGSPGRVPPSGPGSPLRRGLTGEGLPAPRLQNVPYNVQTIAPWADQDARNLMDAAFAEDMADAAAAQYVAEKEPNTWAAQVPLGVQTPGEGMTREDMVAMMIQVVAKPYTGERPPPPADVPRGHPAYERYTRGEMVEYNVYTPAFTIQDAQTSFWDLGLNRRTPQNEGEIQKWKQAFDALGLYPDDARVGFFTNAWGQAENEAMAQMMSLANRNPEAYQDVSKLTNLRDDLMNTAAQMSANGADGSGGSARTYPFTQTNTSTQVSLSNMEGARETLRGYITNMIGRFPSDGEVGQFLGKLNDYERAHPTTTTTSTTYSNEDTSTSSSTSTGGTDPFNLVQEYAKTNTPGDYHAYQQLRYYQAISDILGDPRGTERIPQGG